jgi:hypothetical protein
MHQDWQSKYLSLFVILIAFVDGMLVAKQWTNGEETPAVSAIVMEDKLEQKISSQMVAPIEETAPEAQKVPFVSQAPYGLWTDPWASFAEEASAFMAFLWANQEEAPTREIVGQALLSLKEWEELNLGTYKDTDLTQTLRILTEFYGLQAQISYEVSRETMMAALEEGGILIIPVKNFESPHYGEPGPVFHTLVITAYQGEDFIVNDPGTIRGEAAVYPMQKILESLQDLNGEIRMILIKP